jgi:hypothetical protein
MWGLPIGMARANSHRDGCCYCPALHAQSANPQHASLSWQVWRRYEDFVAELSARFPHEATGIKAFYDECWAVFNSLNVLELKSLEEPRYLLTQFVRHPIACLTLAAYAPTNTGGWRELHR